MKIDLRQGHRATCLIGRMISLRPEPRLRLEKRGARRWVERENGLGGRTWAPEDSLDRLINPVEIGQPQIPLFTEDQYNAHLHRKYSLRFFCNVYRHKLENGWSYEETVYFLDLCRIYNYKFLIISDRYDASKNRSVIDLKERFYFLESRLNPSPTTAAATSFRYDAEWDRKRRLQLESYHSRPTAEQEEEAFIMDEIDRVSRFLPQIVKEREAVMEIYHNGIDRISGDGLQQTMAEVINGGPAVSSVQATPRRKSVSSSQGTTNTANSTKTQQQSSTSGNRRDRKRSIGSSSSTGIGGSSRSSISPSTDNVIRTGSGPGRKPKPTTAPTHLASMTLQPIRVGLCRHVDRMMADYGLQARPNFATPKVIEKFDEIRVLMATLAEAKKSLETLSTPSSHQAHH